MPADRPSHLRPVPSPRDGTVSTPTSRVADELTRVARALQAEGDTATMLDEVVAHAVRTVPGSGGASISLLDRQHRVTSDHSTDPLPARLDAIQADVGEGPCLDATFVGQPVRVPDLRDEQRWPRFVVRARRTDAGSMLSVRLGAGGQSLGSLNLCSRAPDAFDDEAEHVALLFADHAAVAIAAARTRDDLRVALTSRDQIGQAKGILMERYGIDADQAFRILVRVSQTEHRKLRDLARELVVTGALGALKP